METFERKQRRSYTPEEDSTILEMVDGAKKEGMEIGAVYKMLSDDLNRTEAALQKRYGDLKRAEKTSEITKADNDYQEELLSNWKRSVHDMETTPPLTDTQISSYLAKEPEQTMLKYSLKDAEATMDLYEKMMEAKKTPKEEVSLDALVNKLESVITEKIEIRIERDYYKHKFEELQAKYNKVRRFMEE